MTQAMNTLVNKLARPELLDMVPYQSARRLFAAKDSNGNTNANIWLNANEAPGTGGYSLDGKNINRYPDFQPDNLLTAYQAYTGLKREQLLATRGADEGIELIIRTFCRAYQDNILICPPTYGMYAISAENHGAGIIRVPLVNQTIDLPALEQQVGKAKVVFLCSPGNPTGNLLPQEQIKTAIELFADNAIVVVDEAYIEYSANNSVIKWINQYDNLIVLRTLSKAFALAGIRCGFALANAAIIDMMSKVIAPYPVPLPTAEVAAQALSSEGLVTMNNRVTDTVLKRQQFVDWLSNQPWCQQVFSSDTNFVLFRTTEKEKIFNTLKEKNLLIRDQSAQPQLADCLRVTIGSGYEINLLQQTLSETFSQAVSLT